MRNLTAKLSSMVALFVLLIFAVAFIRVVTLTLRG
jgi:hypothetical protein